jgi:uncharacterized protein (DUF427 family)
MMTQATEPVTSGTLHARRVRTEPNRRRVRVFSGERRSRTAAARCTCSRPVLLPRDDVRLDLLEPTPKRTRCPYKGEAVYWSVRVGDQVREDLIWSYPAPIPEIPKIENLLAFFNEKVDIVVAGVPQERPVTKWS